MDPNEALKRLRDRIKVLKASVDADTDPGDWREASGSPVDEVSEVVDLFEGLDTWLQAGGFLPEAWKNGRREG